MGLSHREAGQLYQAAVGRSKELQTRRQGTRIFITPEKLLAWVARQLRVASISRISSAKFSQAMLHIQEAEPADLKGSQ